MIKDVTVLYSDEYIHGTFHASYMVTPENYQAVTFDWDFIIVPGGATSGEPLSPEEFFRRMKLHYYPSVTKQNVSFVESGTTRLATINMYCKDQNFYDAIYTDVENRRYDIIYNEIEKRRIARES
ncbi:hypothetical protein OKW09_000811 [Pseudomonas rhodesiae]|nr:hypothetical protein [Pseudomonas rhodesiae]MDF9768526.1 hypothetical protein [Pseudomonas rhodesiae]